MYRCVIVGCGLIAGGYDTPNGSTVRTHAKAYATHPQCELVGVCDSSEFVATEFGKKWGANYTSSSFSELLSETRPSIVSICTPVESHKSLLFQALEANVQYVWLEKPAATDGEELRSMVNAAAKSNTQVWVNYQRRYDEGFKKVKNALPDLGKIQNVNAFYTKGLRHNGSHLLDLISWFFGSVEKVFPIKFNSVDSFPTFDAILQTKEAKIFLKGLNYKAFELFEIDIIGEYGRIQINDGGQKIVFESIVESKFYDGYKNLTPVSCHQTSYSLIMQSGLKMALGGEDMPCLENEIAVDKILDLCSESIDRQIIF